MNPRNPSAAPAGRGAEQPASPLEIEFFFDFVCPWCLIGKRHLATTLDRLATTHPEVQPRVVWRSYQLLPAIPTGGVPYQSFYVARLGSADAVARRRAQVQQAGDPAGIRFAFDRIEVMPNTLAAHRLSAWAAERGTWSQQSALIDGLMAAYFTQGVDIGDPGVLRQHALEAGYDGEGLQEALAQSAGGLEALPRSRHADHVSGVPFFVFNEVVALSGAQAPETLLQAILQSLPG